MNGKDCSTNPDDYFVVQKRVLKWIGITLKTKQTFFFKIYCVLTIIILSTYVFFIIYDALQSPPDFNEVTNNVSFTTGVGMATIKYVIIFMNRLKLREIMDIIENGRYFYNFRYKGDSAALLIKRCVDFTEKLCLVGEAAGLLTVVTGVTTTWLIKTEDGGRMFPFGRMLFLQELLGYEIVYIFQSISLFLASLAYMTCNIVYATVIAHICVQLQSLQSFIKRMDCISQKLIKRGREFEIVNNNKKVNSIKYSKLQSKYLQQLLKEAVHYHLAILDITEKVDKTFSMTMLAEFTCMSICICLIAYRASLYPLSDVRLIKDFGFLLSSSSTLFLMSYWGNEVTIESIALSDACYETNFVGTDLKFQKGLLLIMQRSQRPIELTIGQFATLSLVIMVSFCRASYSYFMVLRKNNFG